MRWIAGIDGGGSKTAVLLRTVDGKETRTCRVGSIDPAEQKKQTKKNLRKLEKLIRFAETTKFMESEQVRQEVLLVLKLVKREWQDTLTD